MRLTLRKLACWIVGLSIAHPLLGQGVEGRIVGTVVDERGRPVGNAQVSPQFLGVAVSRTLVIKVESDSRGRFKIEQLDWGPYAVYAGKEIDNYPDTRFTVYRIRTVPKVTLSRDHPTGHTVVTIGPRGGVMTASVRDTRTRAPLNSRVVLRRADGSGEIAMSERPDFRVLLPANTNLSIEISQQGYAPWVYATSSRPFLRVKSGEQLRIEVNLTPSIAGENLGAKTVSQ